MDQKTTIYLYINADPVSYKVTIKFSIFVIKSGDTVLLKNMPDSPQMITFMDGQGDSPFHTLLKLYPTLQGKLLSNIVKLLLQKGVSPTVPDRSQCLPIDYVTQSKNKEVFDMLRKFSKRESSFIIFGVTVPLKATW